METTTGNAVDTLALAKAIKATASKTARKGLTVGSHDVDFMVRVSGQLKVGEDYDRAPTVSIPYIKAFAALCHVSGCTGPAGIAKIKAAMEMALAPESDIDAHSALAEISPMVERIEANVVQPMLKKLPKATCKGQVTTKLVLDWQ